VRHPVPFTRPKLTLQSTYPQAWMSHYQAENYLFAVGEGYKPNPHHELTGIVAAFPAAS
jgi:LuxR family transcriptional regulator